MPGFLSSGLEKLTGKIVIVNSKRVVRGIAEYKLVCERFFIS
jgi:hypothetical protein